MFAALTPTEVTITLYAAPSARTTTRILSSAGLWPLLSDVQPVRGRRDGAPLLARCAVRTTPELADMVRAVLRSAGALAQVA